MVKIEEILIPGETVTKKQGGVTLGRGIGSTGDLFLTNTRLLFVPSRLWAMVLPDPKTLVGRRDVIQIPLQKIKAVKKSFGALKVQTDKEYTFMVSVWKTGGWVDAVEQAMRAAIEPPSPTPVQPSVETRMVPAVGQERVVTEKEIVREKEIVVKIRCPYCHGIYDELLDKCPSCGATR